MPDSARLSVPLNAERRLPAFLHAFQPIVDTESRSVFAHEALIRGTGGQGAASVLADLPANALHELDRYSVGQAVASAARLGMTGCLSVNSLPHSLDRTDLCGALQSASTAGAFPLSRIIVEVTETEAIADSERFTDVIAQYRRLGVQIAVDDFGAGHSGLNLLADFQPDLLKLDMNLVRSINNRGPRQAIVRAILQVCEDLGIEVIAEGIESPHEWEWFAAHDVRLFQGFLFARPGFDALPQVSYPDSWRSPNQSAPNSANLRT